MKKMFVLLAALSFGIVQVSDAQETKQEIKQGTKSAGRSVKRTAKKVGNKTAELAVKGTSKVADDEVKDKMAPNGERVYVKDGTSYYWIDSKGRKHNLERSELRDRL